MAESNTEHRVRLDVDGAVATITLDRPNKLNALYPEMILRLVDVIEQVRRTNSIRALVLRGEGRAFCAGDDLSPEDRFKYGPPDLQTRMRTGFPRAVVDLLTLRKPVVGIVQGYIRMPIMAMIESSMLNSHNIASAPTAADGSPERMVIGWM